MFVYARVQRGALSSYVTVPLACAPPVCFEGDVFPRVRARFGSAQSHADRQLPSEEPLGVSD